MIRDFLLRLWMRQRAGLQWRLIWLFNDKFMASVAGVIQDEAGCLLLLRHRYHVGDGWGLPGGIVHAGERLEEALVREIREETGYQIGSIRLLQIVSGYQLRLEVYYQAELAGGSLTLQQDEILEAGWFTVDGLPGRLSQTQKKMIEQAVKLKPRLNP